MSIQPKEIQPVEENNTDDTSEVTEESNQENVDTTEEIQPVEENNTDDTSEVTEESNQENVDTTEEIQPVEENNTDDSSEEIVIKPYGDSDLEIIAAQEDSTDGSIPVEDALNVDDTTIYDHEHTLVNNDQQESDFDTSTDDVAA